MLKAGEDRELSVFIGLPRECRRDKVTIIVEIVRLRASLAHHACEAIGELVTFHNRPPHIEEGAVGVIAASLHTDLAEFLKGRGAC
jgi:hypothetical protein